MVWPILPVVLIVQNSSKSANVRCTAISRVSIASRPAIRPQLPQRFHSGRVGTG